MALRDRCLSLLLLLYTCQGVAAEFTTTETLSLRSSHLESTVAFKVTLPEGYADQGDNHYGLLLDMHPRRHPLLSGIQDWLSHNGEWPMAKTIVVTPEAFYPAIGALYASISDGGDGMAILDFIEKDLLSALDKRYRLNGFRIVHGFKDDGSFALYMLAKRPYLFSAYIATAPSFNGMFADLETHLTGLAERLNDTPKFLWIGDEQPQRNESLDNFANTLRRLQLQNLALHRQGISEHHLMSQPIVTITSAIEELYGPTYRPLNKDSAAFQRGADAIVEHYRFLSAKFFHFDLSAQRSLETLAASLLPAQPDRGLEVLHKVSELYASNSYAWQALAEGYAAVGRYEEAIGFQHKAIVIAKDGHPFHLRKHKEKLAELDRLRTSGVD